jgi:hypothetical protein
MGTHEAWQNEASASVEIGETARRLAGADRCHSPIIDSYPCIAERSPIPTWDQGRGVADDEISHRPRLVQSRSRETWLASRAAALCHVYNRSQMDLYSMKASSARWLHSR